MLWHTEGTQSVFHACTLWQLPELLHSPSQTWAHKQSDQLTSPQQLLPSPHLSHHPASQAMYLAFPQPNLQAHWRCASFLFLFVILQVNFSHLMAEMRHWSGVFICISSPVFSRGIKTTVSKMLKHNKQESSYLDISDKGKKKLGQVQVKESDIKSKAKPSTRA